MEQLKLNMIPNGVNPVFHASQYDKGRQIRFVLDETLSSAEVTTLYRAKDGTEYGNVQTSVSGNTITDTIPEEVLTDYGIIEGEVSIDGIGSLNFFVEVEKDAYDGGVIVTQTASGAIATFETNIETALVSLKSDINPVQSGTGTPSPQNIRPISGFSALNVTRTGKNKLNYDAWKTTGITRGTAVWENNGVTLTATSNDCFTIANERIPVTEGEIITLSWEEDTNQEGIIYIFPNGSNSGLVRVSNRVQKYISYTVPSGVTFVTFRFGVANSGDTIAYKNIQIEKGSTVTDFEPYNGQTVTVNFGQEVYGGVADVTNGKVTITHLIKRIDDLNWYYNSTYAFFSAGLSDLIDGYSELDIKSSTFESIYGRSNTNMADAPNGTINHLNTTVKVKDTDYTDATAFKTALANETIWYKLATPIEITTTPENLTAIVGENNVYSDTNGDTTVEYYIEV